MPEQLLERMFHNAEWKRFLDALPTQHDRNIAGKTMDWVKETYPEIASLLNGALVWEEITEK